MGVGLEMEGVSFTPTPKELARMGKTIASNICFVFHDFEKYRGSYLNMQGLNINCGINIVPEEAPNEKANIGE